MPDYINPNSHTVYLTGPDGLSVAIAPYACITLPDFFERYCPKGFIRRVASANYQAVANQPRSHRPAQRRIAQPPAPATVQPPAPVAAQPPAPLAAQPPAPVTVQPPARLSDPVAAAHNLRAQPLPATAVRRAARPVRAARIDANRKIVGRQLRGDPHPLLRAAVENTYYPISNNIGVGILSYNRPRALKRLINSIKNYTDLRRTTVFISDDGSDDRDLLDYLAVLDSGHDFVVLRGNRLGVAGNSNRLLRCLARFRHGLLLNDDVEVTASGWDTFYPEVAARCGLHHFCMRQPGVYGARPGDNVRRGDVALTVVGDKPQGAVLYFDQAVLEQIGYFDEATFGLYGMEHVDWSERAQQVNGVPGYFDVAGSGGYFTIHGDASAVPGRQEALAQGRAAYAARPPGRGYVMPGPGSAVPRLAVVIPCRNDGRSTCIETVIANVRAQRYPDIEIVVAEHDVVSRLQDAAKPFKHVLVTTAAAGPFNKARVFNAGVARATADLLILHDADMLVPADYAGAVAAALADCDACHLGKTVIYLTQQATAAVERSGVLNPDAGCERVVGYFEGGSLGCHRRTYWRVGGFNQDFVGYGVEDCEFYARLAAGARSWCEQRTFNFIHLWHGRPANWEAQHDRNKEIGRTLEAIPLEQRLADQRDRLRRDGYSGQVDDAMA